LIAAWNCDQPVGARGGTAHCMWPGGGMPHWPCQGVAVCHCPWPPTSYDGMPLPPVTGSGSWMSQRSRRRYRARHRRGHRHCRSPSASPFAHLGVTVEPRQAGLLLHQLQYALDILERAGMTDCKPCSTPVDTQAKLSATLGDRVADPTAYQSLVGALQYPTFTRPDLTYVVE
jgi:hypothetical protein